MALTKIPTHMLFSGAASEDLSIDSDTLFIDSSANRVGIANNSPSVALDVTGSLTVSGTITGADLEIDSGTFSIDSSNNRVGIGTTSPARQLHLVNSGNALMKLESTSASGYGGIDFANASRLWFAGVREDLGDGFGIRDDTASAIRLAINTSGNVGIGTSSPARNLVVSSSSQTDLAIVAGASSSAQLQFGDSSDDNIGQIEYNNSDNDMAFYTNATEYMTLKSDGKLGIGTSSPQGGLHLVGPSSGQVELYLSDADEGTGASDSLLITKSGTSSYIYDRDASSSLRLGAADNHSILFIDGSNQRVGIGTTSPSAELTILKNTNGTNVEFIRLVNDPGSSTSVGTGAKITFANHHSGTEVASISGIAETTGAGTGIAFVTHSGSSLTEKVRINKDGNVGIGTTGPSVPLQVSKGTYPQIAAYGASDGWVSIRGGSSLQYMEYSSSTELSFVSVNTYPTSGATIRAKIATNGDFYTNDGTVSSLSDERIKTNVIDLSDGLEIVNQLRPITYEYNNEFETDADLGAKDGVTRYGFIAQEVEAIAPQYVNQSEGKINGESVDDLRSLSQTKMIPMLVKSIQEQQEQIEQMKQEIEALKNG